VRRRFFVEQFAGNSAVMQDEAAHHLGRVLRAQVGQLYELSDGQSVWLGRIDSISRDRIDFSLLEQLPSPAPYLDVTLLLSVVKFDSFEWALEKATELGVSTVVPIAAGRSEKALLVAAPKRAARWHKILLESSQQSRRVKLPVLGELSTAEKAFSSQTHCLRIMLSERDTAPSLKKVLTNSSAKSVTLAIGPEGGWTDQEFSVAHDSGFSEASLGHLILRTETAVAAALASLNFALTPAE
jgi:16S rRNA (uracil1498-N3)-methyltransferase